MLRLALVVALLGCPLATFARADRSVDWSEFLETDADKKPLVIKHEEIATDKDDAKPAKTKAAKTRTKVAKAKTKKAAAKKPHKRRH